MIHSSWPIVLGDGLKPEEKLLEAGVGDEAFGAEHLRSRENNPSSSWSCVSVCDNGGYQPSTIRILSTCYRPSSMKQVVNSSVGTFCTHGSLQVVTSECFTVQFMVTSFLFG